MGAEDRGLTFCQSQDLMSFCAILFLMKLNFTRTFSPESSLVLEGRLLYDEKEGKEGKKPPCMKFTFS